MLILQDLLGKSNNEPSCSSCRIWGNRATSQALSWPSWAPTLPGQANLGRASPEGQSLRGHLGKPWRHLGRWAIMGPTWDQHEPTWANLGPSWGQLGVNLGQLGPTSGHLGANLAPTWANLDQLGPIWIQLKPAWTKMSQRRPTWGQLEAHTDWKIMEKPLFS